MCTGLHAKYSFLSDFSDNWIFSACMYVYIGIKTFFYVVWHLDYIASYLPTGLHLGFFRSWPSLLLPSSFSSVFLDTLQKYWNIKLYDNFFCGSHVVPCAQTDKRDKRTVALRNFADAQKNAVSRCLLHDFTLLYEGGPKNNEIFFFINRIFLWTFPKFNHPQNTPLENQYNYPTTFSIVQNNSGTLAKW